MKSFGRLPVWSRRAALALGLAALAVVCAASGVKAQSAAGQTPPPQQTPAATPAAQPQPESMLTAKSPMTIYLNVIKPEKAADFEAAMAKIKEALAKTDKEDLKKLADGWQVFKVTETVGTPNVIYLWVANPAVVGSVYDPGKIIYSVFEQKEADEIFNKLKDSYVQLNRWSLEKVLEMKAGG
ncbi:MAG TPA: hypothetical protein VLT86_12715 [Vicinamibacterales bacterium]|nr:hypothetical protein [Vicinamibacterales bacterium]